MATFTITVSEYTNQPPFQTGELILELEYDTTHTFTKSNFTTETTPEYSDPEGDDILKIKILTLPDIGELQLDGISVSINDEITISDIEDDLFTYISDDIEEDGYSSVFTFDVADEGSGQYGDLEGSVILQVGELINLPPDVVGDGEETIDYGEILVFTIDMFTSETIPPYSDPEGDNPLNLKILTLPSNGVLKLNNIDVYIGQEISFSDISSSNFIYIPNNNITTETSIDFEFEISDSGSNNYTG